MINNKKILMLGFLLVLTMFSVTFIQAEFNGGNAGSIVAINSTIKQVIGNGGDVNEVYFEFPYGCWSTSDCIGGHGSVIIMSSGSDIDLNSASFSINGGYAYGDFGYGTDGDAGEVGFSGMNYISTHYGQMGWSGVTLSNVSLGNLGSGISIINNSAYLNPASIPVLDTSADITLDISGWGIIDPEVLQDGSRCRDCSLISYVDGIAIFNVTGFSNYTLNESQPIGVLPDITGFSTDYGGTNFSALDDYTNVTNLTLANENGTIQFPASHSVNASGEDYDLNIVIGDGFVSVNTSGLHSSINHSATITLEGVTCDIDIYYSSGFYTDPDDIVGEANICDDTTNPNCTDINCTDGTVTFTVSHFSGFAVETQTVPDTTTTTTTTSNRRDRSVTEEPEEELGEEDEADEEKPAPAPEPKPQDKEKLDLVPYFKMAGIILAIVAALAIVVLGTRKAVVAIKKAKKPKAKPKKSPLQRAREKEATDWFKGKKPKKKSRK